jgi:tetratricopeptide (TPR) repeat protein
MKLLHKFRFRIPSHFCDSTDFISMCFRLQVSAGCFAALIMSLSLLGCGGKPSRKPGGPSNPAQGRANSERTQLVAALAGTLASWDESHSDEEQRKLTLNQLNSWSEAVEGTEPAAAFSKSVAWTPDPAVGKLPVPLPNVVDLQRPRFDLQDVDYLREATWFHFLATRLAAKPASRDKDIAKLPHDAQLGARIFEWTMLNVALDLPSWDRNANPWQVPQNAAEMLHTPYVTLFTGRGTALARGWVFLSLARQAGLQGVLLAATTNAEGKALDEPRPWVPAILVEGEWYLFDPQLGVPIPGPEGRGVATLKQVIADPKLLRQLDQEGYEYPLKAEQVPGLVGLLEVSPAALTLRMRRLQYDLPERVLALGTTKHPLPSEQIKQFEATGLSSVSLWKHPWQVAFARSPASSGMEGAIRILRRQIAPFEVELPLPVQDSKKQTRREDVNEWDFDQFEFDSATGRISRKDQQTDIQRKKTILELNRPAEIDGSSGDILRFDPDHTGKQPLAKTLRHGRLMQVRGAWLRRTQLGSDGRREQASGAIEVPEDLHGAIFWLLLSKAADGSYAELIGSQPTIPPELKPLLSLLKDASVSEQEIEAVRELILVTNLLSPQISLLERMLTTQGIDASKVREAAAKLLELKTPTELYKYLEPLAKPLNVDPRAVQGLAQSLISGNRLSGDNAAIYVKLSFLRLLQDINRRATLWLGQIQAEQGEFDSAERYFKQYSQLGFRRWYSAAQLNLAELFVQRGFAALEKDPAVAIKFWEQAIAIYKADESPQKQGSLWRAKQLSERISAFSVEK